MYGKLGICDRSDGRGPDPSRDSVQDDKDFESLGISGLDFPHVTGQWDFRLQCFPRMISGS